MSLDSNESLAPLLENCIQGDRHSQKMLYQQFFSYAMSICLRYAPNKEEAQEILNDGFLKVFTKLHTFDQKKPFRLWVRRIMINTAIDYYRKRDKGTQALEITEARKVSQEADVYSNLGEEEILKLVQELSPAYRTIFNLYVIEGFTHEEIAKKLNIHVGTSKSNLAKARKHLKKKLLKLNDINNL